MKRTLSLVLALVMVLGTFTGVFAAETATVDAGKFLEKVGVLEGDDNGNLMLDKTLSRRDMVVLVSRLMDAEEVAAEFPAEGVLTFEDITDAYYNGFIAWSVANKIIEGHDAETFGFNENVTAQQFATVLLRVMGKEVKDADYPKALETAKALGLLADVTVENATEITRAQMAAMTLNALKAENGKLAKELDIELPEAPKAAELTAQVNETENLVEIVVELSNADLAIDEKLENASNYKLNDSNVKIKSARVDGDNVVLLLDTEYDAAQPSKTLSLVKGRTYTLSVRGIDKAINKDYKFKANDITAPGIENVEVLGEYGIKVTTTEPVKDPQERDFLIDGKRMSMVVEQYGRDIILTPYYDVQFDKNATELKVLELTDFAGHKSSLISEEIEIIHDDVAPEVVSVIRSRVGKQVTVVFDKDVYLDSVNGYKNYRNVGNISYKDGRQTVYAEGIRNLADDGWDILPAEKIALNVVRYTFKEDLPRNIDFTIEGVQNHSGIEMVKVTEIPTISLEDEAAEIINGGKRLTLNPYVVTHSDGTKEKFVDLIIKFDKKVVVPTEVAATGTTPAINYSDYFSLYKIDLRDKLTATNVDDFITNVAHNVDKYGVTLEDELVITFKYDTTASTDATLIKQAGLLENNRAKDYDYILESIKLEDQAGNKIARSYVDFEIITSTSFKVASTVYAIDKSAGITEFKIKFTKPVDIADAKDGRNYVFTVGTAKQDLDQLNGEAIVERDGYTVTLRVPERFDIVQSRFNNLEILQRINSTGDQRLSGPFNFGKGSMTINGLEYIGY